MFVSDASCALTSIDTNVLAIRRGSARYDHHAMASTITRGGQLGLRWNSVRLKSAGTRSHAHTSSRGGTRHQCRACAISLVPRAWIISRLHDMTRNVAKNTINTMSNGLLESGIGGTHSAVGTGELAVVRDISPAQGDNEEAATTRRRRRNEAKNSTTAHSPSTTHSSLPISLSFIHSLVRSLEPMIDIDIDCIGVMHINLIMVCEYRWTSERERERERERAS